MTVLERFRILLAVTSPDDKKEVARLEDVIRALEESPELAEVEGWSAEEIEEIDEEIRERARRKLH